MAVETQSASAVSFIHQIAPIFVTKCQTCHGPEKNKGGYRLHTFDSLIKKGDGDSAPVVAGHPERSEIYRLITAKDEDDRMPQKGAALAPSEIHLIAQWIREGAHFDGTDPKATLASIIPRLQYPSPPGAYPEPVPISAMALNPDGGEIATSGYHEINIWRRSDGALLQRITNVAERILGLAYNRNGSSLAAATGTPGQIGELLLINCHSNSPVRVLTNTPDVVVAVCFSPVEDLLAAGGSDNAIRIYDRAGREQRLIQQHADWIVDLCFSADGKQLLSASRDRTARVFNVSTGELESTYAGHEAPLFAACFVGNGNVASSGRDRKIHLWTVSSGKKIKDIDGFEGDALKLVASTNRLFAAFTDGNVREYHPREGKLVKTFSGQQDWIYSAAVNPQELVSGCFDGYIRIWNVETGALLMSFAAAPGFLP